MTGCDMCGQPLSALDLNACKKFVNRDGSVRLCLPCLAKKLGIPERLLLEKIETFRAAGCLLFAADE